MELHFFFFFLLKHHKEENINLVWHAVCNQFINLQLNLYTVRDM